MDLQLQGQRVVVFGAAQGLGRAIADGFASEGCEVFGFDLLHAPASTTSTARFETGDVTSWDRVRSFVDACGPVDHMVYSVGVGSGKFGFPFWNLTPDDWPRVLEVNLLGAVHAAHACAPGMVHRRKGSMLFVVSVAGQMGSQTDPPYSAAKAGLINFVQCAAKDLAPYGVRSNALSPGMVQTGLNRSVWQAGQRLLPESARQDYETWASEKIRKVAPLGRWQAPEEFAAMAVFLASEHARNITGQTLNIDGGQVMHA
ncbi:MAG: SDR family oxidoreductase [Verrucomicrobia bacterium]|nr:SDR family oxidoreductase [Verrucomicrobiota bacterium]